MQLPYTGSPSYETIARRFSSPQVDPQAYFTLKQQQKGKDRGEFVDIHDVDPEYSPGPNEYDVLFSDVTHAKLQSTIAEQLGIPYLSEVADAKEVIQVSTGYIRPSQEDNCPIRCYLQEGSSLGILHRG